MTSSPTDTLSIAVFAVVLVSITIIGIVTLIVRHRRHKAEHLAIEVASEQPLPDGAAEISWHAEDLEHHDHSGRIMLVLVGTFAESLSHNLLNLLHRCGLEGAIGSVLLAELDDQRRSHFLRHVDPVFHDRIVTVRFGGLSGGLGNRSPAEVRSHIEKWGPPIINGAREVCQKHLKLNRGQEPALVLTFISQGGQAIIGTKAVETISRRFHLAQHFGFTALPVDDLLRARVEEVLDAYRHVGVSGFTISDNLHDEVLNDFGMISAIAGFVAHSEHADAATEQNNAWYRMYQEAPAGLVSFSTHVQTIPGYEHRPHASLDPRYFVYHDTVVSHVRTGLSEILRDEHHALGGEGRNGHVPLTSVFEMVLAAIHPDHLKAIEDEIVHGKQLTGHDRRNHHQLFAPITTLISPSNPECPVAVVGLHALSGGHELLRHLTQTPALTANHHPHLDDTPEEHSHAA